MSSNEVEGRIEIYVRTSMSQEVVRVGAGAGQRLLALKDEINRVFGWRCQSIDIVLQHKMYSLNDNSSILRKIFQNYKDDDVILVIPPNTKSPGRVNRTVNQSPEKSGQTETGKIWNCPKCTFENREPILVCVMCNTQRPTTLSPSSVPENYPTKAFDESDPFEGRNRKDSNWADRQNTLRQGMQKNSKKTYRSSTLPKNFEKLKLSLKHAVTEANLFNSKSSPLSPTAEFRPMQGNVKKKNKKSLFGESWTNRYWSLSSEQLHIFKTKSDFGKGLIKETIQLKEIISCVIKNSFCTRPTIQQIYNFITRTDN